jgi:hypothetical protein
MRHAYGNADGDSNRYAYTDSYANCDSNSYAYAYGHANGNAKRNTYSDAYLHARSGMGDCCASANCALWEQRSFRWYVLLFNRRL